MKSPFIAEVAINWGPQNWILDRYFDQLHFIFLSVQRAVTMSMSVINQDYADNHKMENCQVYIHSANYQYKYAKHVVICQMKS